jgi:CcmD family protein
VKSYAFLFWGYLVVWAGLAVYLTVILRSISSASRRLDELERKTGAVRPPAI